MENFINQAKSFMATENGQKMEQAIEQKTGVNLDQYLPGNQGSQQQQSNINKNNDNNDNQQTSQDAFGNQGALGQFGQQGQYGAVTGQGLGGGFNSGSGGQNQGVQAQGHRGQGQGQDQSAYVGYEAGDSTASGGYGRNAQGGAFSRQNQMGADNQEPGAYDVDDGNEGYKTGTSTPGYRQEGDVDAEAAENRLRNQNLNQYGQQSDERGSTGNDYHEAI